MTAATAGWTRNEPESWPDEGLAGMSDLMPEGERETEWTAYYTGPNGGRMAISYWIEEHWIDECDLDPQKTYPLNQNDEPVLYGLNVFTEYTPASQLESGESSSRNWDSADPMFYWTLDSAREATKSYADRDESSMLGPDTGK